MNQLENKSLYSFGDSLIAGHSIGIGMLDYIAQKNNLNYTKYAQNGATIIPCAPQKIPGVEGLVYDIGEQIIRADSMVPDFICFDGLTNDITFPDNEILQPGHLSSGFDGPFRTSSFTGAFERICYLLRKQYSDSKILYITPHKMCSRNLTAQESYINAAIAACKKWSIPYVDIYHQGGINTCIDDMRSTYSYNTADKLYDGNGTHLNAEGYKLWYAPLIESALRRLATN